MGRNINQHTLICEYTLSTKPYINPRGKQTAHTNLLVAQLAGVDIDASLHGLRLRTPGPEGGSCLRTLNGIESLPGHEAG